MSFVVQYADHAIIRPRPFRGYSFELFSAPPKTLSGLYRTTEVLPYPAKLGLSEIEERSIHIFPSANPLLANFKQNPALQRAQHCDINVITHSGCALSQPCSSELTRQLNV